MGERNDSDDEVVGEDEVLEGAEDEPPVVEDSAEDAIVPLKTQLMRLQWTEIVDPIPEPEPEPKKRKSKGKKKGKGKGKKAAKAVKISSKHSLAGSDSESGEDDEEEEEAVDALSEAAAAWRDWSRPSAGASNKVKKARVESTTVPEDCPAADGVMLLLDHPLWLALRQVRVVAGLLSPHEATLSPVEQRDGDIQLFSHILTKIESGNISLYFYVLHIDKMCCF
jgi:hypothetical protein